MVDLGNKVIESTFNAWCDGDCEEYIPSHNEVGYSSDEVTRRLYELVEATREQRFRIEHEIQELVNRTERNTFVDGFYIGIAVATGKVFQGGNRA